MDLIYAKDKEDASENKLGILQPNGHFNYVGQDLESLSDLPASINRLLVRRLDLSFNLLKSLDGLERFENIEELILDNNELGDDFELPRLHRLHTLSLNKNSIAILTSLMDKIEDKLPCLKYLSLLGNEACPNQLSDMEKTENDYKRYRYYVLYRLPRLKFLDASQIKEKEIKEAKRIGEQLRVARPRNTGPGISVDDPPEAAQEVSSLYSPLPAGGHGHPSHQNKATFGKCKYVYYGKHSEGNRFIRNNDL